jgi:magnesium-transporting ATPase (P-type)
MMRRNSVSRRLIRGLGQVGLVGTLLLLAAVVFFYRLTFSHLEAGAALQRAILESLEHVALPVVVLMVPVTILGLRSSGRPLFRWRMRPRALKPSRA